MSFIYLLFDFSLWVRISLKIYHKVEKKDPVILAEESRQEIINNILKPEESEVPK